MRRRLVQFLMQGLQHPGGFLAAGNAQIEPRFGLAGDRIGIVVAIVAGTGRNPAAPSRPSSAAARAAFGELHASAIGMS